MSKYIKLTQGKRAIVDDEDYEELNKYRWYLHCTKYNRYARRNKIKPQYMHRAIMKDPNKEIDHFDGNGLNNQKDNLRNSTRGQNSANIISITGNSMYKGVSYSKQREKWCSHIMKNYKSISLGRFTYEAQAAIMYDIAAIILFGEYSRTNFLKQIPMNTPNHFYVLDRIEKYDDFI